MLKNDSVDDIELFRRSIGKISLLKYDKFIATPLSHKHYFSHTKPTMELATAQPRDLSVPLSATVDNETTLSFMRSGLQLKQFRNLRAGKIPYEAVCDLHNSTQQQAEQTLATFIYTCHQQGLRVLCVVHGKGQHSNNVQPLLKNLVNQRLREFSNVLAFCSAKAKNGGAGAVYVLLKNKL